MKVLIRTLDYSDALGIMFYEENPDGSRSYAKPVELEFVKRERSELGTQLKGTLELPNYSFDGKDSIAVQIMQQLDSLGTKLPEKKYLEGRIEQMEKHLEDMRKLVFGDE